MFNIIMEDIMAGNKTRLLGTFLLIEYVLFDSQRGFFQLLKGSIYVFVQTDWLQIPRYRNAVLRASSPQPGDGWASSQELYQVKAIMATFIGVPFLSLSFGRIDMHVQQ